MQAALYTAAFVLGAGWLWFLARGRTRGATKRLALRATLLALTFGLVALGMRRGLFTQASAGFRAVPLVALFVVCIGYLYLTRFCPGCGRMVRNLKDAICPRCGGYLPLHGMTSRLRRPGDGRRWDPLEKRARPERRDFEGPRA